jgi:TonB family protein
MRKKSVTKATWCEVSLIMVLSLCALVATGQETRKALSKPAPAYPDVARRLNLAGVVKVEVVVGPDGEIKDTKVIGGHPLLVDAALKALRDWKYERAGSETKLELEFKFQP